MLSRLEIVDFALIENATIDFRNGFTVLTGETGAGKSILIDAIGAVCGERANKDLIRTGRDISVVTAIFDDVDQYLSADELNEYDVDEDNSIIITREIHSNGKSYARINDKIVQISTIRKLSSGLIDIHGQNENQSIFKAETQIALLDRFGGKTIFPLLTEYTNKLKEFKDIKKELSAYVSNPEEKERTIDFLKFQIKEIMHAKPLIGEDEKLNERRRIISNAEKIKEELDHAFQLINGEEGIPALPAIKEAARRISSGLGEFAEYSKISNLLLEISYNLEEVCSTLSSELDNVEVFPGEAKELDDRIDLLYDLKHKYGGSIESVLDFAENAKEKLTSILNSEKLVQSLNEKMKKITEELTKLSNLLYKERVLTGDQLAKSITAELSYLGMSGTVFEIKIEHEENSLDFKALGQDKVEYLLSPNVGEELKPLVKIASGGESSRIMLAIKTIFANSDKIPLLIFDEIDVGISGKTGDLLAEKLMNIASTHQVLCVTHMAQIAAKAHNHIKIDKYVENNRTFTRIAHLEDENRLSEIARLLSGENNLSKAIELARDMIN